MERAERSYGHVLAAGLSTLAMAGCGSSARPNTEIVVVVHADESIVPKLQEVQALLYPVDPTEDANAIENRRFRLTTGEPGAGQVRLPFSFGIAKGKDDRFLLVITGYASDATPVIEHKLTASFQRGQTLAIDVLLREACYELANRCSGLNQTCEVTLTSNGREIGACSDVQEVKTRQVAPGQELDASIVQGAPQVPDGSVDDGAVTMVPGRDSTAGDAAVDDAGPAPGIWDHAMDPERDGAVGDAGVDAVGPALGIWDQTKWDECLWQ